jgi:hypothetical protein
MAKDKYTLPIVDSLKDIGFQFEYSRIKDAISYIKSFVQDNFKVLQDLYFFENASYDEDGNIVEVPIKSNAADSVDELPDEPEKDLVDKIERIKSNKIKPRDYIFHVHPVYANDKEVLVNVYNNRLRALYGAKGNLIYRGSRWGINFINSINECFYHRILDDIIFKIRDEGKVKSLGISENYLKIKELLADSQDSDAKVGPLAHLAGEYKNRKELAYYQGLLMSENLTLKKSAGLVIWKSHMSGPIDSTIDQKERTIRHYLRLQTAMVTKGRDSSRKNKGINKSKRDNVIQVFKSNRKLSHVKIAEITGVNRKTVAKYINEI